MSCGPSVINGYHLTMNNQFAQLIFPQKNLSKSNCNKINNILKLLLGNKCEGVADLTGATGATDAVDVVVVGFGDGVVDDVANVGDIDTAGSHVGGDQDTDFVFLELVESALALALRFAAVDGVGREAALDEFVAQAFDAALGFIKDNNFNDCVLEE